MPPDTVASLPPVEVVQNAYVVRDLEAACHRLHELYRIGPFLRSNAGPMTDVRYRGAPAPPVHVRSVFAQSGAVNIELIQPLSDPPHIYDDVVPAGTNGFHHVATWSADYDREKRAYRDAGFEIAMEVRPTPEFEVSFIDARPLLGHMIELYPDRPFLRFYYDQVRSRTREWDGRELILDMAHNPTTRPV